MTEKRTTPGGTARAARMRALAMLACNRDDEVAQLLLAAATELEVAVAASLKLERAIHQLTKDTEDRT